MTVQVFVNFSFLFQIPETIDVYRGGFILVHSFRGFSL